MSQEWNFEWPDDCKFCYVDHFHSGRITYLLKARQLIKTSRRNKRDRKMHVLLCT